MLPPEKAGTRKWNSVSSGKGSSWKCAVYIDFLTIMRIYSRDSLGTFTYQDSVIQNFFKWVGIFKIPLTLKADFSGFPGGAVVESLPANAGDTGSSPGPGRSHMPQSN